MMKLDNFIGMMTGHFDNKEQFSLEVSEIIEVNGKRTFGYDDPIIYKRV